MIPAAWKSPCDPKKSLFAENDRNILSLEERVDREQNSLYTIPRVAGTPTGG